MRLKLSNKKSKRWESAFRELVPVSQRRNKDIIAECDVKDPVKVTEEDVDIMQV